MTARIPFDAVGEDRRRVRWVRVLAAVAGGVAAGAAFAVTVASGASAAGCSAAVPNSQPSHNQTVTVSFTGPPDAWGRATAHFPGVDTTSSISTDGSGQGSVVFHVTDAPYGDAVVVDVSVGGAACATTFTPGGPVVGAPASVPVPAGPVASVAPITEVGLTQSVAPAAGRALAASAAPAARSVGVIAAVPAGRAPVAAPSGAPARRSSRVPLATPSATVAAATAPATAG
ncbi:MAG TPA: hypothetical protein VEJ44_01250, partial [Acidimicrobiales bacterium]|nr:hypothetical protein [Acidimicrobiales bacterium]